MDESFPRMANGSFLYSFEFGFGYSTISPPEPTGGPFFWFF
jgi:hypothetical protein